MLSVCVVFCRMVGFGIICTGPSLSAEMFAYDCCKAVEDDCMLHERTEYSAGMPFLLLLIHEHSSSCRDVVPLSDPVVGPVFQYHRFLKAVLCCSSAHARCFGRHLLRHQEMRLSFLFAHNQQHDLGPVQADFRCDTPSSSCRGTEASHADEVLGVPGKTSGSRDRV